MGKDKLIIAIGTLVVIDKGGVVRYVRDDVQMAVRNQELIAEIDKF